MAKREKRPKSKARKIIEWVLIGIFGAAACFAMAATISGMVHKKENHGYTIRFGIGTFVVQTDSMEPEIKKGDMIITKKEDINTFKTRLESGETIDVTFFNQSVNTDVDPDSEQFKGRAPSNYPYPVPMTHRLREVHQEESGRLVFVVSGINSGGEYSKEGQYQFFTEEEYFGTVKVSNSFLGHTMNFISSPIGLIVLLLVPAAYLIIESSIDIFKAVKESEETEAEVKKIEAEGGDRLNNMSDEERKRLKDELLQEMLQSKKEGKK